MKNFLVVGGSTGIGLALAGILKAQGANVIVACRHQSDELKALGVTFLPLDVKNAVADALSSLPEALNGVAYCPGTINLKPFHRITREEFQEDLNINVLGAVDVLQNTLKNLKKADSASVVLFSTVAATLGMNFHSSIALSKAAIEGLGKSLAAEWANLHIRVNIIAPSLTNTPLANKLLGSDEKVENAGKRHPIGRIGTSEDIAEMAAFLLSDKSSWITGQTIGIDGGMGTLKP